jgi:hypothetical protein
MNKKFFLHIGSEKTGTTALARSLNLAASDISKLGILYPRLEDSSTEDHRAIAIASSNGDFEALERQLAVIGNMVTEQIHTIVISSEMFFHIPVMSADGPQAIDQMREKAKELGFSFEIIAYLRSQDHLLYALYNQSIKWDSLRLSFEEWVEPFLEKYNYDKLMEQWSNHCDKLHVHLYEPDALGGDIVPHFMQLIEATEAAEALVETAGVHIQQAGNPMAINMGLSNEAIEIVRALAEVDPPSINAISNTIFTHGDASFYNNRIFSSQYTNREWQKVIDDYYSESNSRLAARLGIGRISGLFTKAPDTDYTQEAKKAPSLELLSKLFLEVVAENRARMFDIADVSPGVLLPADPNMSLWFPRGWCRPEAWGAWTLSEEADIVIKTAGEANWMRLHFDLTAFVPGEHTQEATLCLGGCELAKWEFSAEHPNLNTVIDVDLDPKKPVHTFKLKIPTAQSPRNLGVSLDHRSLGLGLRRIEIHTRQS